MSYLCSTCATNFESESNRREHMRARWHVYNVKRRVATLPRITLEQYDQVHETKPSKSVPRNGVASTNIAPELEAATPPEHLLKDDEDDEEAVFDPSNCLFCTLSHSKVSENLAHMTAAHGFIIPNLSTIQTDLETFVSYLSLVVNKYHECLHCGHVKHSAQAVRAHMSDKAHRKLDLSENSEYLAFWDKSDEEDDDEFEEDQMKHNAGQTVRLSSTELRLPSGEIVTSRQGDQPNASRSKKARLARRQATALAASTQHNLDEIPDASSTSAPQVSRNTTRALALRSSMGLTGLSDSQRHSLAVEQRKIDLSAFRARNKAQWILEKMGNKAKQKHFRVGSICRSGLFIDPTMF
ncbi:C2H2 finger domain protein [Zymoseptoria brevis]|uniref:C2H2 finger domain protein n=1 Tax=Zymoseptoria brevis TaxID=1047168 RepID=A0A0F4GBC5_9PEZI|nr:C2H2 finger domain protein [Zymoseptoria brevis]